jgi:hypothetical protein
MSDFEKSKKGRTWAFQVDESMKLVAPKIWIGPPAEDIDASWWELLREHMPYHHVPADEMAWIVSALRDLELLFLNRDDSTLNDYYQESFIGPARSAERDSISDALRHVMMLQARLMERAFYILHLDRYANAPSNSGWMNLFRRWGDTGWFNAWFATVKRVFSPTFVHFYEDYIAYYREGIDVRPVPHPWDHTSGLRRPEHPAPGEGRANTPRGEDPTYARPIDTGMVPGIFLDSGIVEQPMPDENKTPGPADRPVTPAKDLPPKES